MRKMTSTHRVSSYFVADDFHIAAPPRPLPAGDRYRCLLPAAVVDGGHRRRHATVSGRRYWHGCGHRVATVAQALHLSRRHPAGLQPRDQRSRDRRLGHDVTPRPVHRHQSQWRTDRCDHGAADRRRGVRLTSVVPETLVLLPRACVSSAFRRRLHFPSTPSWFFWAIAGPAAKGTGAAPVAGAAPAVDQVRVNLLSAAR